MVGGGILHKYIGDWNVKDEQVKTLEALQIAVQMERDGREYYQKASRSSDNQLGRELFQSLAAEEDVHRQKFEEIYNAIRNKKAWPETDFQPDGGKRLRTIFVRAVEEMGSSVKAPSTELDAIQTAMDMENKSYDFYKSRSQVATYDIEKDFYETLAAEEREHHLILLDYFEYLKDPAGWFVKKEHPSLDGG
jgi:rubrerythrin